MDVILENNSISCCKLIWSGNLCREETGESVVPDVMPDISEVIDAIGCVTIRSKEVSMNRITLDCNIETTVLYVPESETGVRKLKFTMPCTFTADAPGVDDDCQPIVSLKLTSMDARMVNSRKVLARACVCADMSCYKEEEIKIASGVTDATGNIHTLTEKCVIWPVTAVREKTFTIEENVDLPVNDEIFEELLGHIIKLRCNETNNIGSKLIMKGEADLLLFCACGEGREPRMWKYTVEFSQVTDAGELSDSFNAQVSMIPTGVYIDAQSRSDKSMYASLELHVVAQFVCTDRKEIVCLTDAYSNKYELDIESQNTTLPGMSRPTARRDTVRETIRTDNEPTTINYTYALEPWVAIESGKLRNSVQVHTVYTDDAGLLRGTVGKLISELQAEPGMTAAAVESCCMDVAGEIVSGGVSVKAAVSAGVAANGDIRKTVISSIYQSDNDLNTAERPSITVITADDSDSLWTLAKRFGSSTEIIANINALEENVPLKGRTLLIPKSK